MKPVDEDRDKRPRNDLERRVSGEDRQRTGSSLNDTEDSGPVEDRPGDPAAESMDPDEYGGHASEDSGD